MRHADTWELLPAAVRQHRRKRQEGNIGQRIRSSLLLSIAGYIRSNQRDSLLERFKILSIVKK